MEKLKLFLTLCIIVLLNVNLQAQTPNPKMWITNGTVNAIAVDSNYLYLAGTFSYVLPNIAYGAKLTTTYAFGDNTFPTVNGLIRVSVPDGNGGWYIGGFFTQVGNQIRNQLARINSDGSVHPWDPNANGLIYCITENGNDIYITDSGNEIIDLHLNEIEDSLKLEQEIKLIPGVVEVGLFNNIANMVIVGKENSTEIISRE